MPKVIDENKIFETVIDMLVSRGYDGATTKEIAEIADVNEATLFRKYSSKAKLFEKAIEHQLSNTPLTTLVYTGDLEADLYAIVEAYMETNRNHGEIIPTILAELPRHPELKGAFSILWENTQVAAKILQAYQSNGKLKEEPVVASLNGLLGPLMTSQMFGRTDLELPVLEINPQEQVNFYLRGREN
jgi:AcrR family transcriptional regulator